MPILGTKVIIDDKYSGFIVRISPPNEFHSGKFTVQVHCDCYGDEFEMLREFQFSDYGVSVKEV